MGRAEGLDLAVEASPIEHRVHPIADDVSRCCRHLMPADQPFPLAPPAAAPAPSAASHAVAQPIASRPGEFFNVSLEQELEAKNQETEELMLLGARC